MKHVLLIMMLCLVTPGLAIAHSTKGKTKVPLTKNVLGVDDVAYYMERYVTKTKYKDRFKISKNRFYVRKFNEIKQDGKTAEVFFTVLDMKEKDGFFDDSMVFKRDNNGGWINMEAPNDEVYTYIGTKVYYAKKYGVGVSLGGLALCGLGGFFFRFAKKRKTEFI